MAFSPFSYVNLNSGPRMIWFVPLQTTGTSAVQPCHTSSATLRYVLEKDVLPTSIFLICLKTCPFSSIQFSRSVISDSLRPHELQDVRPPCSSPTPRVHSNSCPLVGDGIQPSHLCRPLLLLPLIPPSIKVFPISQLFP